MKHWFNQNYKTLRDAIENNASLYEIKILHKHNIININPYNINFIFRPIINIDIVKYIFDYIFNDDNNKNAIDRLIYQWLYECIYNNKIECYDYIYNLCKNDYNILDENIIGIYIYTAVKRDYENVIKYFKNKGYKICLNNISLIIYDNIIIEMFDKAIKYDVEIYYNYNIDNIINEGLNLKRFDNIKNLDYIYKYIIQPNIIINNNLDWVNRLIDYAVSQGCIEIYNWIKENNLPFCLKKYDYNETYLLEDLDVNSSKYDDYYDCYDCDYDCYDNYDDNNLEDNNKNNKKRIIIMAKMKPYRHSKPRKPKGYTIRHSIQKK